LPLLLVRSISIVKLKVLLAWACGLTFLDLGLKLLSGLDARPYDDERTPISELKAPHSFPWQRVSAACVPCAGQWCGVLVWMALSLVVSVGAAEPAIRWAQCLRQPDAWYATAEASRVASNVCAHQRSSGGWPKNIDMAATLSASDLAALAKQQAQADSTIDNGATTTQIRFLARVHSAAPRDAWGGAIARGVEYLLSAQYTNGGWPQYWPKPKGYAAHITFNDNAMVNVLTLLREVSERQGHFGSVDRTIRERAATAVERGVDCILRCQVKIDGRLTAWCAQHDETTLEPAGARSYEHPSLSGSDSAGIVRFLMELQEPDPRVVTAIEATVAWFKSAQLRGIRVDRRSAPSLPKGYDHVVVEDPAAPPIWARFYDLRTGQPIFSGRDGVIKNRLADIEHERRVGYAWYTDAPSALLRKAYPAWRDRLHRPVPGDK